MSVNVSTMQSIAARTQMVLDRMAFEKVCPFQQSDHPCKSFRRGAALPSCCWHRILDPTRDEQRRMPVLMWSLGDLVRALLKLPIGQDVTEGGPKRTHLVAGAGSGRLLRCRGGGAGGAARETDGGGGARARHASGPHAQDRHQ